MRADALEARELEPHQDLRSELLGRMLQAAMDDPLPGIPAEEAFTRIREEFASLPEPAVCEKHKPASS